MRDVAGLSEWMTVGPGSTSDLRGLLMEPRFRALWDMDDPFAPEPTDDELREMVAAALDRWEHTAEEDVALWVRATRIERRAG